MKRVLVTGGGGFIGHHLTKYLRSRGLWVRGVDIKYPEFSNVEAHDFKLLDLRNFEHCLNAVRDIDEIYNLAANMGGIGFISTIKANVLRDNILINANLLEAAQIMEIKKIFFSSSACIYPKYKQENPEIVPLKEDDAYPADPEDGYGWEKLISERMYKNFEEDHNVEVRIARYHNIYGVEGAYEGGREKSPAALCRKIALAKDGDEIEIWGDGQQTRSFCYIDDCILGTYFLMNSDFNNPLNIGSDRLISIDDMVDIISNIAKKKIIKKHLLDKPQGVRGRNADLTLMKKTLRWEPTISLEEGLKKTYEWIEKRKNGSNTW